LRRRKASTLRARTFLLRSRGTPKRPRPWITERGSALVEFAFVCIIFLTLLFGITGFGHALYAYHFVSNAAREGSRWAAVNGKTCAGDASCTAPATSTDIQNYVKTIIPQGVDATKVTITPSWPVKSGSPQICSAAVGGLGPFANYPGCTVEVQVQYTFNMIFPLVSTGPLTFSSSSDMVIVH
jgi:Flp pilus assembly protein TadG